MKIIWNLKIYYYLVNNYSKLNTKNRFIFIIINLKININKNQ